MNGDASANGHDFGLEGTLGDQSLLRHRPRMLHAQALVVLGLFSHTVVAAVTVRLDGTSRHGVLTL